MATRRPPGPLKTPQEHLGTTPAVPPAFRIPTIGISERPRRPGRSSQDPRSRNGTFYRRKLGGPRSGGRFGRRSTPPSPGSRGKAPRIPDPEIPHITERNWKGSTLRSTFRQRSRSRREYGNTEASRTPGGRPREAKGGPGRPREAQGNPRRPWKAQEGSQVESLRTPRSRNTTYYRRKLTPNYRHS